MVLTRSAYLYRRDLSQIWIFGKRKLQVEVTFFRWDLTTPCIKNSECKSQEKKTDPDCNFYNFSLLVSYPDKFVVVCICIVIFHCIYSCLLTNIFLWEAKFFLISCSQVLGIFQISWGPSVLGFPNFLFGGGGLGHFLP